MSDMKCPFCQQELDKFGYYFGATPIFLCNNCNLFGGLKLWQELIRTRKALEIAVDALKEYANEEHWDFEHFYSLYTYDKAKEALEQITALEQKEHFADASKTIKQKDVK